MGKKLKSATNNQWVSITVDPNMVPAKDRQPKTAGDNQWTSTSKNPMK
ncbi:hypothetical protein [Clostridium perfringens]|nr:hypothetical protein [Clostridium perfringens]UBK86666.1 hypothetical protein KLF48_03590 [Clostridium perfringens]